MDIRLEKALEFSSYMTMLNNQKRILKEKFLEDTVHYVNGGKFTITKELLNFCNMLLQHNQYNTILIDDNDTPIEIVNLNEFTEIILTLYVKSSNEYFAEYQKIKNQRSTKGLVDLWVKVYCFLHRTTRR